MGQQIVYCAACGIRLLTSDFQKGTAVRSEGTALCGPCALKSSKVLRPPAGGSPSPIKPTSAAP